MNKQKKADLLLIMVTMLWGMSCYLTDLCLTEFEPNFLNAFRFLLAFAVLGAVFWKRLLKTNRETLRAGLIVGLFLTGTYVFYNYGIAATSITNAAFICSLPAVTTPIFAFILFGIRPKKKLTICLVMCTIGLALLTLNESFRPAIGDVICLGVPFCYAFDLLSTERFVQNPKVDALSVGVIQLGVVGVISLILSFILERPAFPKTAGVWAAALYLGIICSGVAFVVQVVQQKYTSANHVGLIFTLEPLFAAASAFFLAGEVFAPRGYIGMILMLLSTVIMEVDIPQSKA